MSRDVIVHRPGSLLGVLNVALGAVLLIGTPARTSSASFMTAREIMPIGLWGLGFLLIGIGCLLAPNLHRWRALPVIIGAGAHTFWAVAFLAAAAADQRAALTGIVVYAWIGLLHFLTGMRLAHPARRAA